VNEQRLIELLSTLTSGWSGFAFYWLLFILVAALEVARPSRRARGDSGERIGVNFGLGLLITIVQMAPFFTAYSAALFASEYRIGLMPLIDIPFYLSCLVGFLLLDFSGYIFHRASHQIPLLWRLHRIHHTDRFVDASTTFRSHPLALIIFIAYDLFVIALLGIEPAAVLIYAVSKMVTMWLSHADVKAAPRLSAFFSTIIVTPAYHHRHHSADQIFTDSNYGEVLTIWDRLLGTMSASGQPVARYGLGDRYDPEATRLISQLKLPFRSL
jgi:sterol desaturase/sphingolipid hydroxylase (fatty acid hydroxylase superfamily)